MKNIIKNGLMICMVSLCATMISSCDDFLNQTPPHLLSEDGYWNSESAADKWMAGTYNGVESSLGANVQYWGDSRTDNLFPTTWAGGEKYQFSTINATDKMADWTSLYTVIARCNIALRNLADMDSKSISESKRNNYMGQCYGLRALSYMYIARLWGSAPLILKPYDGDSKNKYVPRSSSDVIAAAIESDINTAERLLVNTSDNKVWYFGYGASLALKIDFLAWRGRYPEIPAVYDNLMAVGGSAKKYKLISGTMEEFNNIFVKPESSSEAIFAINYDEKIAGAQGVIRSSYASTVGYAPTGNSGFVLSNEIWSLMVRDTMDYRLSCVMTLAKLRPLEPSNAPGYGATASKNANVQQVDKYWPLKGTNSRGEFTKSETQYYFKLPVYRLADVMLLYAEALNRLDRPQEALDIVNDIRHSRGSSLVAFISQYNEKLGNTPNSREKLIMDERQLELFDEGKRWFDLLRMDWGMEVLIDHLKYLQYAKGSDMTGFTDPRYLLWPVAQTVLSADPNMRQNPGY